MGSPAHVWPFGNPRSVVCGAAVLLLGAACSPPPAVPAAQAVDDLGQPTQSVAAFDGQLRGWDVGEWGGRLAFVDAHGRSRTLLEDNVRGIVQNDEGIFVFTGLAHMSINRGAIYQVTREANGQVSTRIMTQLPGSPWHLRTPLPNTTTFWVFNGWNGDGQQFQCRALVGGRVGPYTGCRPEHPQMTD